MRFQALITRALAEVQRLWRAAGYSWAGYRAAWRSEASFRLDLLVLGVMAPLAFWVGDTGGERALLLGSLLLVVLAEVMNTAIEAVVDRVGTEPHPLSAKAKDLGSGAVLVALVNAALAWLLILMD